MTYEAQNKVLYLEHLLQSAKIYGRLFLDSAVSQNFSTVVWKEHSGETTAAWRETSGKLTVEQRKHSRKNTVEQYGETTVTRENRLARLQLPESAVWARPQ